MTAVTEYTIELDNNAEDEFEYEDALYELNALFSRLGDYTYIQGRGMGWTRANGYVVVKAENAVRALQINGDYRIVVTVDSLNPDVVTAVRYSHDEPTGAGFTLRNATQDEIQNHL